MALMDEFREEREAIKNAPLKARLAYFWDYYKWYVIVPAAILIFVGGTIYQKVTAPEVLMNGICINTYSLNAEDAASAVAEEFAKEQDIDLDDYAVDLNTGITFIANDTTGTANYESSQTLMAWIAAGSVDFLACDYETMEEFCYKGYFQDLRDILTEEQLKKYEPYFLYMDEEVELERQLALDNNEETSEIVLPDCREPETMGSPIPIMIDVSQSEELASIYSSTEGGLALGFAVNGPNLELTLEFVDYLLQ